MAEDPVCCEPVSAELSRRPAYKWLTFPNEGCTATKREMGPLNVKLTEAQVRTASPDCLEDKPAYRLTSATGRSGEILSTLGGEPISGQPFYHQ
jgi:hypothetical protein